MPEISIMTRIDAPVELCFDLARDVNVHQESAAFSGERPVGPGKLTGLLEVADLVCFEGRHFGFRQRFCARITEMDRPHVFVDEMVRGIFVSLRHTHEFSASDASTMMVDHLEWRTPLGVLGRLADRLFLERHMASFVRAKQRNLQRIVEERHRSAG